MHITHINFTYSVYSLITLPTYSHTLLLPYYIHSFNSLLFLYFFIYKRDWVFIFIFAKFSPSLSMFQISKILSLFKYVPNKRVTLINMYSLLIDLLRIDNILYMICCFIVLYRTLNRIYYNLRNRVF